MILIIKRTSVIVTHTQVSNLHLFGRRFMCSYLWILTLLLSSLSPNNQTQSISKLRVSDVFGKHSAKTIIHYISHFPKIVASTSANPTEICRTGYATLSHTNASCRLITFYMQSSLHFLNKFC